MNVSMKRKEIAYNMIAQGAFISAMPLALDEEEIFDEFSQRRLIRYYLEAGVQGIAVGVHTTQFEIRQPQYGLFERVLEVASREISLYEEKNDKVIIKIAGACGETAQAVSEAESAKRLGYDSALLSPGGLKDLTEQELIERTKAVAEILPVFGFYLQEAVGGRRFSFEHLRQLCDIPGVIAIKCAPFDRYATLEVVRAAAMSKRADEIALYTGNDDNILMDLLTNFKLGVKEKRIVGGLLGHWAVWTHKAVEVFDKCKSAAQKGEITPELVMLSAQITDMNSAVFDTANNFAGCIAGINEVLYRQGLLKSALCLDPVQRLSPGQAREIERVRHAYGELIDDDFVSQFLARDN